MCIKCWSGMMNSSYLDCLSSIHSHSTSILNPTSSNLQPPTSKLLYQTSILNHQLLFLNPPSKVQDMWLKCPQNSVISDKMSASAACSFFQVSWISSGRIIFPKYLLKRWPLFKVGCLQKKFFQTTPCGYSRCLKSCKKLENDWCTKGWENVQKQ